MVHAKMGILLHARLSECVETTFVGSDSRAGQMGRDELTAGAGHLAAEGGCEEADGGRSRGKCGVSDNHMAALLLSPLHLNLNPRI